MHWKVLLILLVSAVAYVLLGAVGFHYIERPREASHERELRDLTRQFFSQHSCLDAQNLTRFFSQVLEAYKAGYRLGDNGTVLAPAPKWDYASAIFFCMTVITTIGYGNLSPSTFAGQAYCCIYALIGIPMLAILLSGLAQRFKTLKERIQSVQCWRDSPRTAEVVTTMIYFLLGFVLFFIVPAASFTAIEGWSFSEGMYYSLVTLSTIGFGDYVAGQSITSAIYKLCLALWIYLGLVFMSGVISTVQSLMERGAKNAEAKVDAKEDQQDEEKPDHGEAGTEFDETLETEQAASANESNDGDASRIKLEALS